MLTGGEVVKNVKVKKKNPKLTIESQINSIMSLPETEEDTSKPKKTRLCTSKNKSLSRILEYCFHEPIIDIKFIGKMMTLYGQSLFQKASNDTLYAAINPIKSIKANAKKPKVKNFIPEATKMYITMGMEKVYNLLLTNNATQLEATKLYKSQYDGDKKKCNN